MGHCHTTPTRKAHGSLSGPQTPAEPAAPEQPQLSTSPASPTPDPVRLSNFPFRSEKEQPRSSRMPVGAGGLCLPRRD